MATYEANRLVSAEVGSAITIYRFIVAAADGQHDHVGSVGGDFDGIAQEGSSTVGDVIPMAIPDGAHVKVEAGAAIAINATVMATTDGKCITHVSAAGDFRAGKAITAAAADGDIITIRFLKELDEVT